MKISAIPTSLQNGPNAKDLAYFISLQEERPTNGPDHSAAMWNRRAEFWKKERENHRKGDERVLSAVTYLSNRGLLQPTFDIIDIGCGPGRFVAAFAKQVHRVVGLDISEKMVAHGREYIQEKGLHNAILRTADFQTFDVKKEGYEQAFDVVFSSMTPAIHGMNGLMKCIEMSRAWCCHITHLSGRNLLREQIMKEVFGRAVSPSWSGRWFYSLFNVLFLMGYAPETTYETRHQERQISPDEEYVDFMMEHMLPAQEQTRSNAKLIERWLKEHVNEEGMIREVTDASYGRVLWDVRQKVERPDYRSLGQGV